MTRLPTESRDYTPLEGAEYPDYKVGPYCAVPGCPKFVDDPHHIVRRSELAGAYWWVRMPDEHEVGNVTGLCHHHHQQVTENKASISYIEGEFFWIDNGTEMYGPQLLNPQPPTFEPQDSPEKTTKQTSGISEDKQICPGCGRRLPTPKIETDPEAPRNRKTWAIAVPADEREDGANTLDALLDAARDEMDKAGWSYSTDSKVRFYVLTAALAMFVQHSAEILSDQ